MADRVVIAGHGRRHVGVQTGLNLSCDAQLPLGLAQRLFPVTVCPSFDGVLRGANQDLAIGVHEPHSCAKIALTPSV